MCMEGMLLKKGLLLLKEDYYRTYKKQITIIECVKKIITSRNFRYLFSLRVLSRLPGGRLILHHYTNVYGMEIPISIGGG